MKLFKNWEQVNDRRDNVPYLSGASENVVFHIQVRQTGLLSEFYCYMEIVANEKASLAQLRQEVMWCPDLG